MNKFGSWKDRLSDSLNKLPNLDNMAKEDEYIHSSEFRVSKKKPTATATEHIFRSKSTSAMVSLKEEKSIEKSSSTSDGDKMKNNKDNQQYQERNPMKPPRTARLEMNAMITPQVSKKMEYKLNTIKPTADIYDRTKDTTLNTLHQLESAENARNWSLLDIMEPETKSVEHSNDTSESIDHNKPTKNEEASMIPKKKEFVPLMSVVEAIMTEKKTEGSIEKSNETKKNTFFEFDHPSSLDDYDSNESNVLTGKKNLGKEIISNIPQELHYESDSSQESDLENDFVTRMHKNSKTQNNGASFSLTDTSSMESEDKNLNIFKTQSLTNESAKTSDIMGKPIWFDVFDQTKEYDIENDPLSVIKTNPEISQTNSMNTGMASSTLFALNDSFLPNKLKDNSPGFSFQLNSVSNTIAQKWKQHNVGAKLPLKSFFEPSIKSEHKSFEALKLKTDTMLQINENEYVQKDSRSLFAQDDQAEWEKIKALTASTPLTRLIAFWEKHDNYIYLCFTFFLMIFVYFYVNKKTMVYGLT